MAGCFLKQRVDEIPGKRIMDEMMREDADRLIIAVEAVLSSPTKTSTSSPWGRPPPVPCQSMMSTWVLTRAIGRGFASP